MAPPRVDRVCRRCGETSRPGNRVGTGGICRLCADMLPMRMRQKYSIWKSHKRRLAAEREAAAQGET